MTTQSDNYWKDQGRNGGNTPTNDTSDKGWKEYNDGKELRQLDRVVEESNKKLYDANNNCRRRCKTDPPRRSKSDPPGAC
jgi:hypothetical protein